MFDQSGWAVRFEWGRNGLLALAPASDVIVIVDVLSFTTCVEVATARGALIYPYGGPAEAAADFARARRAHLASRDRGGGGYSLSPHALRAIPAGTRLVLPSPNGATLSLAAADRPVLAGCLRNAEAVAARAQALGERIAVIAAGERWPSDGSLRPAVEDLLGAGAILQALAGRRSPEAELAVAAFEQAAPQLAAHLAACGSGQELITRGFPEDVALAAQHNVSAGAPLLADGAFSAAPA